MVEEIQPYPWLPDTLGLFLVPLSSCFPVPLFPALGTFSLLSSLSVFREDMESWNCSCLPTLVPRWVRAAAWIPASSAGGKTWLTRTFVLKGRSLQGLLNYSVSAPCTKRKQNRPPFLPVIFASNLVTHHFFHIFSYISGLISLLFSSSCILKLSLSEPGIQNLYAPAAGGTTLGFPVAAMTDLCTNTSRAIGVQVPNQSEASGPHFLIPFTAQEKLSVQRELLRYYHGYLWWPPAPGYIGEFDTKHVNDLWLPSSENSVE